MTEPIDPRFSHETYERNIYATREELTGLSKILLDMKVSWFAVVVNVMRVAGLLIIFKIRQAMFEEEMILGKQIYERKRAGANEGDLSRDDLDALPRRPNGS